MFINPGMGKQTMFSKRRNISAVVMPICYLFFMFISTAMGETYQGTLKVLSDQKRVVDTDIELNSGYKMPIIGFGTYTIQGKDHIHNVVDAALKAGYRSFDTATVYQNEAEIGDALKELLPKYNLTRNDIFITSKLAPADQGADKVKKAVQLSLTKLRMDYLDLYLIHWPGSKLPSESKDNSRLRAESWQGLSELVKEGKLKSIGVSNYLARHIEELLSKSTHVPALNQVELHPYWQQKPELYDICAKHNILIQAYSSLGGNRSKQLISDASVVDMAKKLGVTPAQVLLRWGLQRGLGIIPKSGTPERIELNSKLDFKLEDQEMNLLNNLNTTLKFAGDPENIP